LRHIPAGRYEPGDAAAVALVVVARGGDRFDATLPADPNGPTRSWQLTITVVP
jgi:hypothetical protein